MEVDDHRWSGWPGAWCLDCGVHDPAEACMAEHDAIDFVCAKCGAHWPQDYCPKGGNHVVDTVFCPEHPITKCPEPGSNKHNPYSYRS
jgi:hypothetical protein